MSPANGAVYAIVAGVLLCLLWKMPITIGFAIMAWAAYLILIHRKPTK